MPWNETTRREYARRGRGYTSDPTDREWVLVAPFLPARKKIGQPRTTELRDVYDANLPSAMIASPAARSSRSTGIMLNRPAARLVSPVCA